jgi:enoyl-CoA hydratase/carnithine racemase
MGMLNVERIADGTMRVELARPEVLNAFDEAMIAELDAAFAEASRIRRCAAWCSPARAAPSAPAPTSSG